MCGVKTNAADWQPSATTATNDRRSILSGDSSDVSSRAVVSALRFLSAFFVCATRGAFVCCWFRNKNQFFSDRKTEMPRKKAWTPRANACASRVGSVGSPRRGPSFTLMIDHDGQRAETGEAAPLGSVRTPMAEKKTFVRNNPAYGYTSAGAAASADQIGLKIDCIRELDFPSLLQPLPGIAEVSSARQGQQEQQQQQQQPRHIVYLDHAGATLFGASQLREAMEPLLTGAVHGNPHSQVQSCAGTNHPK